jgi:ubiquinone/menaquinone biosynthesis C-methylase UbiE
MFSDPEKNIATLGITEGMKVVDLGAGSGFYTIEAAKKAGNTGMVYAVDVQRDLVEKIKKSASLVGLHNIQAIWGNVEKLGGTKLRDSIADRVVLSNTLFQIEGRDRDNLALEIKRLLKPGGLLMIIEWTAGSPLSPRTLVPPIVAQTVFEKAGLTLERSFDAGDHHYGLIMKRP